MATVLDLPYAVYQTWGLLVDFTYQRWEIRFADQRLTPSNIDEISTKHPVEESLLIEDT